MADTQNRYWYNRNRKTGVSAGRTWNVPQGATIKEVLGRTDGGRHYIPGQNVNAAKYFAEKPYVYHGSGESDPDLDADLHADNASHVDKEPNPTPAEYVHVQYKSYAHRKEDEDHV